MATAYQGIFTGENAKSMDHNDDEGGVGNDISGQQYDNDELQQIIDSALIEMNSGNYEEAIVLLDKAKQLYPNSRAEELQDLIVKLKLNTTKNSQSKASSEPPNASTVRQRKQCDTDTSKKSESSGTRNDYTNDQLNLVKKINSCTNFYQVLSVTRDASESEIKKSYKKLALHLHPDKNHAPGAAEAFKTLGNAMNVLTDARKRKEYDLSGGNYITANGNTTFHKSPSYHQFYHTENVHQHHHHQQYSSSEATFNGNEEFTAEELFHMFFGNYPPQSQGNYRRRPYQTANQRQPQENGQQPSLAFVLILVMIMLSMFMSLFSTDPVYSLSHSSKFNVRRQTQHLSVPYYVKDNFENEYQGSLARLENSVEEDYVYTMKQHCFRERSYREAMMARARSFGSRAQFAQAQGEIDDLIEKLKATTVNPTNNPDNTTTLLNEIAATKDPKLFDKYDLADNFLTLIQCHDINIRKEASKCIAELTKSEEQRKKFTKPEVIKAFIDYLRDIDNDSENMELTIQNCRALGNICYLNDDAREIILDLKGDMVLIKLLNITDLKDKTNALQFIKVRGGLLSNYLLGGETLAKRAMDLEIMSKISNIIAISVENVEENEDLLLNTLPLMSILTENVSDLNFEANLNLQLARVLAASTNPDLAEMCLELLHYQAENDDVKVLLAKDGLCETIYQLLEKYKTLARTSEARALMKLACELIVLVLTGDESMHYLYTTSLLKNMENWLSSDDVDLLTTGVLALGNFARTDSHCIHMVENKTMNKLLDVLAKNNGVRDDVRLQHALLSTLRNLVIPKANKSAVIQAGLVETILPMLEIHQPPVVFKLLGTLRMTVDGQEKLALELLKNTALIDQLVHWSKSSDYAGVTGESFRLMAWLIKHAYLTKIAYALPRKGDAPADQLADKIPNMEYDRSSLDKFIGHEGSIEAMVNMLTSQHLVMQNEALIALCILCVVYLSSSTGSGETAIQLQDAFIKYEVGKKLAELINKSSDTMTKEIVENLQNFINLLRTSEKLVGHLEAHNISELLKTIPILTEYCTI